MDQLFQNQKYEKIVRKSGQQYPLSFAYVRMEALENSKKQSTKPDEAECIMMDIISPARPFQVLCKLKKTDIRYAISYSGQSRFFRTLPAWGVSQSGPVDKLAFFIIY